MSAVILDDQTINLIKIILPILDINDRNNNNKVKISDVLP